MVGSEYQQPPNDSSPQHPPQSPQQPGDPGSPNGMPATPYPPVPGYTPPPPAYFYPPAYPAYPAYPGAYGPPMPQPDKVGGVAIGGFVLGVISMIAWLLPVLGLSLGIPGIILSAIGRTSTTRRTLATWGLVLSIIALVLAVGNGVLGVILYLNRYHYPQP